MNTLLRSIFFLLMLALNSVHANNLDRISEMTTRELMDSLQDIDEATVGLQGTTYVDAFIVEGQPAQLRGGVLESPKPKEFSQMIEIVRRGNRSLPLLLRHLDDKRPTKLLIGEANDKDEPYPSGPGKFFTFAYFDQEYHPRFNSAKPIAKDFPEDDSSDRWKRKLPYTVTVGDVCYALVGQIPNRSLMPIRYQPTAGLVVNSPVKSKFLAQQVRKDWGGVTDKELLQSSLIDAATEDQLSHFNGALRRLRFYFPEEYERQKTGTGRLKQKIDEFESSMNKPG